jgi:hypothetical protein
MSKSSVQKWPYKKSKLNQKRHNSIEENETREKDSKDTFKFQGF